MSPAASASVRGTGNRDPSSVLPPGRIGNLTISEDASASASSVGAMLAEWTAPGGDFSDGAVSSYRFVASEDVSDLVRDDEDSYSILLGVDRPSSSSAGSRSSARFSLPRRALGRDLHVAAFAIDAEGNRGKLSNIVTIRIEVPEGYGRSEGDSSSDSSSGGGGAIFSITGGNPDLDWVVVGAIAGVVGVLLLLSLVTLLYYFVRCGRKSGRGNHHEHHLERHRPSSVRSNKGAAAAAAAAAAPGSAASSVTAAGSARDETDSSSFDSDIKNIMGDSGSRHHLHQQHLQHLKHLQHHNQLAAVAGAAAVAAGSSGDSGVSSNSNGGTPTGDAVAQQQQQHSLPHHHSHHHPNSSSVAVTPVYWSASQLLSKLDQNSPNSANYVSYNDGFYGGGAGAGPASVHQVPAGPHSLQQTSAGAFRDSLRYSTSSSVDWNHHHPHHPHQTSSSAIPEEYTITVGNLVRIFF